MEFHKVTGFLFLLVRDGLANVLCASTFSVLEFEVDDTHEFCSGKNGDEQICQPGGLNYRRGKLITRGPTSYTWSYFGQVANCDSGYFWTVKIFVIIKFCEVWEAVQ